MFFTSLSKLIIAGKHENLDNEKENAPPKKKTHVAVFEELPCWNSVGQSEEGLQSMATVTMKQNSAHSSKCRISNVHRYCHAHNWLEQLSCY